MSDQAILPAASLCSGSESAAVDIVVNAGRHYRATAPQHRMSALQDLLAGRPLEVNETLGYALDRALALGLTVPMLDCFRHLVAGIDRARRAPPP